ncbi:alpha/beta hydrolase family protein [Pontibacter vulgaris]|uniref:alpha/beta hydrolase family protein n=1 Tax=Pontibacter vulgaris TaxID=2905679 RepID=UPI001FA78679|nr:alpha/beta fold hydrolase [Pontibacter vulgaris]
MKCKALVAFVLLLCLPLANYMQAQNLKRRAFLGVQTITITDSLAKVRKLPAASGALVVRVIPGSTAAAIKLQPNDIILTLNNKSVGSAQELVAMARQLQVGEKLALSVFKAGKAVSIKGKVQPMPQETAVNGDVIYDEVALPSGGYVRSIIKKPKGKGKFPAVFFIQGFNCGSIDNLPEDDTQRRLMDGLLAKGYLVYRIDKPGTGDTKGTKPCSEITYQEEVDAFKAALKKLKTYDAVDTDNIFLFGHSLGGNTAPLIAAEEKVKGIITYGAAAMPWFEYLIDLYREQRPLYSVDYVQVEDDMKTFIPLLYELMVQKKTPEELAQNPKYKTLLQENLDYDGKGHLFARNYKVLQQLQDIPFNKALKEANAYTLAIYGEADVQSLDAEGARMIADVVNSFHPGKGESYVLPRTDHGFVEVGIKADYIRLQAEGQYDAFASSHFNYKLIDLLDTWIKDKLKKA